MEATETTPTLSQLRAIRRRISLAVRQLSSTVDDGIPLSDAWLTAVLRRVEVDRADLAEAATDYAVGIHAGPTRAASTALRCRVGDCLIDLTIGDIAATYEAVLASHDHSTRRKAGQFFTPDDVARFMAASASQFPRGDWLDPCCGVGNLAWHLADVQPEPTIFVRDRLSLGDIDPLAVTTAVLLIGARFGASGDDQIFETLGWRARRGDYLGSREQPTTDFVIANPPYAFTDTRPGFATARVRDTYAYFMERIATTSTGYVTVTPSTFLGQRRYAPLRELLVRECRGGDVFAFDNVPDTLFRGFKPGSTNTSQVNFVRAAITVVHPDAPGWRITPILRWARPSRVRMFREAHTLLAPLATAPSGEWLRLHPDTVALWRHLQTSGRTLGDLTVPGGHWTLEVASTPRYYLSASVRHLDRSSVQTLHFASREERNEAYLLLNSSLHYWWWRATDGGVTLTKRTLVSMPIPACLPPHRELNDALRASEEENVQVKLNAGKATENVKHPPDLVEATTRYVVASSGYDGPPVDFAVVYSSDMFASSAALPDSEENRCHEPAHQHS